MRRKKGTQPMRIDPDPMAVPLPEQMTAPSASREDACGPLVPPPATAARAADAPGGAIATGIASSSTSTGSPRVPLSRRSIVTFLVTTTLSASLLVLLFFRLLAASQALPANPTSPLVNHEAPDFALQTWTWDGTPSRLVSLSASKGHPVVVNFWASWCDACRAEEAAFEAAYRQYQPQGVVFLGLAYQDKESEGVAFLRQYHVTFPSGPPVNVATPTDYAVTGVPETIFIDRHGVVQQKLPGGIDASALDRAIQALLNTR